MIGRLPLATLRILDLARALAVEPDVLLLDEMTAALPTDLVERVLTVVRAAGRSRAGRSSTSRTASPKSPRSATAPPSCAMALTVGDLAIEPGVEERIVELMLGGAVARPPPRRPRAARGRMPTRRACGCSGLRAGTRLADVSLRPARGRGAGRRRARRAGPGRTVRRACRQPPRQPRARSRWTARPSTFRHPADAIAAGLTLVPGDRAACAPHVALGAREHRPPAARPLAQLGCHPDARRSRTRRTRPSSACRSTRARRARCAACPAATSRR